MAHLRLLTALALLSASALADDSVRLAPMEPSADPAAAPWREVAPGVEHLRLAKAQAELFRFDLARYRAEVVVTGAARPLTAAAVRAEKGAILAVNGGFFDTAGRPLGLRIAAGQTVLGLRRRVDWGVLLVRDTQATLVHSRAYAFDPRVTDAIQVGPRILVDGRPTRLKPQVARRTAVALDREGRRLTVVVTRQTISATALARELERLGFHSALMLDGGPSTQLSAEIGNLALEIPGGYPVPDALVLRPRGR
jgi:hypothetical protein